VGGATTSQTTLPLDFAQETDSQFLYHFCLWVVHKKLTVSSSLHHLSHPTKEKKKSKHLFLSSMKIDEQEVEHALSLNNYHKAQRMLITSIGF
jgi:hypothetical protein